MARAKTRKWIDLVAGLLVGAAAQPLALFAGPDTGLALLSRHTDAEELVVAQLGGGISRARAALNGGIDALRVGDLDTAATLFNEAKSRANDLSSDERLDLERMISSTAVALQTRREVREQINQAELAKQQGRTADATALAKKITANELYLSPADKQRFQALCQNLHGQPGGAAAAGNAPALARTKLLQARAEMTKGDLDRAEALAHEADQLHAAFSPQEDSPRRLLDDVSRAHKDAKTLLQASRAALQRGAFDKAEQYAHSAEQLASPLSFPMWGDSPAKVLKEIQTARTMNPSAAVEPEKSRDIPAYPVSMSPDSQKANADKARALVQEGRSALLRGDLAQARKYADEASAVPANLHWSEDNPIRLKEDIARVDTVHSDKAGLASPTVPAAAVAIKTKEEAAVVLKQGREQLAKGDLDEAHKTAARLHAARHIHWGLLFEDTPDRFQADLDRTRAQRNKDKSAELLVEARRLFEAKDYDKAEKLAYEAQSKHGPYGIWDLGDRPNKLLADVQAARQRERRIKLPDPPAATTEVADLSHGPLAQPNNNTAAPSNPITPTNPQPMQPASPLTRASFNETQPANTEQARKLLREARLALGNGEPARARMIADQVRDMHVVLNVPGEDTLESIYRDIERLSPPRAAKTASVAANPQRPAAPGMPNNDNLAAQTHARQLLNDAKLLQRQNRLVEAREKIEEVRRLGVAFRPEEEGPSQLYQQLAIQAHQRIDSLVHHAQETLRYGTKSPQLRCQEAEEDLSQAQKLAVAFGQDKQPIEATLLLVNQLRTTGNISLVGATETAGTLPPTPPLPGGSLPGRASVSSQRGDPTQLLEKARLELRSGETANARRLTEEAVKLGAGEAGLDVLRSIDTEENYQRQRVANRAFDAVIQAYNRRDYRQANLMLANIDTKLLDERRSLRLREMFNTPEMQPSARGTPIALTAGQTPGVEPGRARVTDDPGQSLLARTKAMREVKFQQLRSEGLNVQSQALERYRSGQPDAAVDMLQEYLARLFEEQLDPGQLTLLRRPIDSRLQQFQLLRAQSEMTSNRIDERSRRVQTDLVKAKTAEQVKQKNVAELMKQYNELMRQAHYDEAEVAAMKVKELDPDNPMAAAAVTIAHVQRNRDDYQHNKDDKEKFFVESMNDTDKFGDANAIKEGIAFPKDRAMLERMKGRQPLDGLITPRKSAEERNIERKLTAPVTLSYVNAPMKDVIEYIREEQGLNIYVDSPALAEKGIYLDSPVTIKLDQISLKSALNILLHDVHLTYVIGDDVLKITTEDHARGKLEPKVYQVTDLVTAVENFGQVGTLPDNNLGMQNVMDAMKSNQSMGQSGMAGGQTVGLPQSGSMANGGGFAADAGGAGGVQIVKSRPQTHEDMLIKLITNTIAPNSWTEQGGPGTIEYHPLTSALVINQTPDIQDQVADLLNALRRLIDQEVAVEIRFISIAEDFFERIGVNFNMNIVNRSRGTLQAEPQLTSGQFAAPGYINAFEPTRFLSGLTPAGTLTSDLNIPVTNSTYSQAVPPFGGYPGVPGFGGLTMGLAFLSDIQVFLFMEAVQGDVRSNVMQAPKLTMFNGQTATLAITDFQFFTIGVNVTNGGFGQLLYNPVTTLFPLGVTLTMNAVISGDRRFVRMSLSPTLSNVVNGEVNLFPVVTPIFPLFDGTATGQPIVFTQFVQQPRLTRVSVLTTVAVPDGGTVLMGGLKRLSEGRNEYGPPVISKIPYLNRLFRNIGYGRSAESLLIMVTPRIIIQAEEEVRQTGYSPEPAVPQ